MGHIRRKRHTLRGAPRLSVPPLDVLAFAARYACPDCDASTSLTRGALGVWSLDVRHDGTCPAYRRMSRERES